MDDIRIVLVGTSHPGNIGAAARAMKTMGLSQLVLVAPPVFPHEDATARAAGALDLLESACVCDTLDEAIAGCEWVLGASARERTIPCPQLSPREAAERMADDYVSRAVALVFGRERTGLSNEELDRCHALVTIPANPEYGSLNLAAAVQVLAYELRVAHESRREGAAPTVSQRDDGAGSTGVRAATADEMERFYEHLERVLTETGFLDPDKPRHLMRRLRRLFNRSQPDHNEINILRGILTSVERPTGRKHED